MNKDINKEIENDLKKLNTVAWGILFIDIFVRLNSFFFIFSVDIIIMYFSYLIWWSIISKIAIKQIRADKFDFFHVWVKDGLAIEDNTGNIYFKSKLEKIKEEKLNDFLHNNRN